jgi:ubiquinone/menaquinone biosynthesis C-methylase UbiE
MKHPGRLPDVLISRLVRHRYVRRMLYPYVDWRDRILIRSAEFAHLPLPPAALRFRVHGDLDLYSFMETGRQCSADIRSALARIGKDLDSYEDILDFGCGCGRILMWFDPARRAARFYGSDIDSEAINWSRDRLPSVDFRINGQLPPLPYANENFDLVYAISIFTHMREDYQFYWLEELKRVVRTGGNVLLTVRGDFHRDKLSPQQLEKLQQVGFLFERQPQSVQGIFPEYYQRATQSREYILSNYSKYFEVLEYVINGLDHCQDLVVLRKT